MRERIRGILGTAAAFLLWPLSITVGIELSRSFGGVIGVTIAVIGFWILGYLLGKGFAARQNRQADPNRHPGAGRTGEDGTGKHRLVEFTESLTAQLYLLAYDTRKQKLQHARVEYLLRAAAITDLLFHGRLGDQQGKVHVSSQRLVGEPMLDAVLRHIVESKSRSWQNWIGPELIGFTEGVFTRAVRDRLATLGVVELKRRRILGIVPSTRILVHQPQLIGELTARVHYTLRCAQPASRVDPHDAALVALAAATGLKNVLPRRSQRTHKARIAQLAEHAEPAVSALRNALSTLNVLLALGPMLGPAAVEARGHPWPSQLI